METSRRKGPGLIDLVNNLLAQERSVPGSRSCKARNRLGHLTRPWVGDRTNRTCLARLKNTILGDMNRCTVQEVEQLLREGGSGRIKR